MSWAKVNMDNTKELLKMEKVLVITLVGIITGHCVAGVMLQLWSKAADDSCEKCFKEDETVCSMPLPVPAGTKIQILET